MKAFVSIVTTPGEFYTVQRKLKKLWPTRKSNPEILDFDVVVGFCDIIVEVSVKDTKELLEKVLDKLMKIPEISVLRTFISIIEPAPSTPAKKTEEVTTGYVFINVVPEKARDVLKSLLEISGVTSADLILGEYDIVAKSTVPLYLLPDKISDMQKVDGVKRSVTCIPVSVIKRFSPKG